MINKLKEIILDSQDLELKTGLTRHLKVSPVSGKAKIMKKLKDTGTPCQNILSLNFFDDRLQGLRQATLGLILEAYYSLCPEKKIRKRSIVFLMKYKLLTACYEQKNVKFILQALRPKCSLKKLPHKCVDVHCFEKCFPFHFKNFLTTKNFKITLLSQVKNALWIQKAFTEY